MRKMKHPALMLILFSVIGGSLILLGFRGLIGAEVEDRREVYNMREEISLNGEWRFDYIREGQGVVEGYQDENFWDQEMCTQTL